MLRRLMRTDTSQDPIAAAAACRPMSNDTGRFAPRLLLLQMDKRLAFGRSGIAGMGISERSN